RHHGLPTSFTSDRDARFTSDFWTALFKGLGTKIKMSTAYHPQTDGQTERANRTLIAMLRSVTTDDAKWEEHLPLIEHAYNSTTQASTGYSPFYLLYGRDVPSPLSRLVEAVNQTADVPTAQRVVKDWTGVHRKVAERMAVVQEKMRVSANKHRQPTDYNVGDYVMLNVRQFDRSDLPKLRKSFAGPFAITRIVNPVAVELRLLPQYSQLHPVFHVSKIKPYVPDPGDRDQPEPPGQLEGGRHTMTMDKITAHELIDVNSPRKGYRYYVHWQGYPESRGDWLLASEFLDAPAKRMLKAYQRKYLQTPAGPVAGRTRRGRLQPRG
ncbi:MAG: hypothetical protein OIF57_15495, partial [Marinobacterium sp.]|nr:hypothetical protein [Marinobacterium sp.]